MMRFEKRRQRADETIDKFLDVLKVLKRFRMMSFEQC